ncbi:MAG: hypothetical protein QW212_00835 [Nitrososphaerales archaeon]
MLYRITDEGTRAIPSVTHPKLILILNYLAQKKAATGSEITAGTGVSKAQGLVSLMNYLVLKKWVTAKPALSPYYREPGPVEIVRPASKLPEGTVDVVDDGTFNKALELLASGPVLISTQTRVYRVSNFDRGVEIIADQLEAGHRVRVQPVTPTERPKLYLETPPPPVPPPRQALVTDDRDFDVAMEMAAEGPIQIEVEGKTTVINDFDQAAETIANHLIARRKILVKRL